MVSIPTTGFSKFLNLAYMHVLTDTLKFASLTYQLLNKSFDNTKIRKIGMIIQFL